MKASYAWLILLIFVTVFVAAFDISTLYTHKLTMTGQMRLWLHDAIIGPFIVGGWTAIFVGLMYHFFVKGAKQ